MTTLTVNTISTPETRRAMPSTTLAGVDWPLYKLQAVVVGLLLALVVGVGTQSGELTAWAVTLGTAATWWTRRTMHVRRARA